VTMSKTSKTSKIMTSSNGLARRDTLSDKLKARSERVRSAPPDTRTREHLVMVLDCSGSMSGVCQRDRETGDVSTKLEALHLAAQTLYDRSVSPASMLRTYLECVVFGTTARFVDPREGGTEILGATNFAVALDLAVDKLKRSAGYASRRIILMSDGQPTDRDPARLWELVREADQYAIVIDTVAFGHDADHALLEEIAKATGGVKHDAITAEELDRSFKQLDTATRGLLGSGFPADDSSRSST